VSLFEKLFPAETEHSISIQKGVVRERAGTKHDAPKGSVHALLFFFLREREDESSQICGRQRVAGMPFSVVRQGGVLFFLFFFLSFFSSGWELLLSVEYSFVAEMAAARICSEEHWSLSIIVEATAPNATCTAHPPVAKLEQIWRGCTSLVDAYIWYMGGA
jgi:hypothetical protein